MTEITIPPDTEEKVAEAICDAEFWPGTWATLDKESNEVVVYRKQAHAACLAMLKAWPGMSDIPSCEADGTRYPRVIHLPINTENTNAEG